MDIDEGGAERFLPLFFGMVVLNLHFLHQVFRYLAVGQRKGNPSSSIRQALTEFKLPRMSLRNKLIIHIVCLPKAKLFEKCL